MPQRIDELLELMRVQLPDYPLEVRLGGIEGEVAAAFAIDIDGFVKDVAVVGTPTSIRRRPLFDRPSVAFHAANKGRETDRVGTMQPSELRLR